MAWCHRRVTWGHRVEPAPALVAAPELLRAMSSAPFRANAGQLVADSGGRAVDARESSDDLTITGGDQLATDVTSDGPPRQGSTTAIDRTHQHGRDDPPSLMGSAETDATIGPSDSAVCAFPDDVESDEELSFAHDDPSATAADRTVYFRLPPQCAGRSRTGRSHDRRLRDPGRTGTGRHGRRLSCAANSSQPHVCPQDDFGGCACQRRDEIARFLAEAEVVARLQHPNVVQIRHIGEAGGLPFFELEYLDGGGLDRRLTGMPWPARRSRADRSGRARRRGGPPSGDRPPRLETGQYSLDRRWHTQGHRLRCRQAA